MAGKRISTDSVADIIHLIEGRKLTIVDFSTEGLDNWLKLRAEGPEEMTLWLDNPTLYMTEED